MDGIKKGAHLEAPTVRNTRAGSVMFTIETYHMGFLGQDTLTTCVLPSDTDWGDVLHKARALHQDFCSRRGVAIWQWTSATERELRSYLPSLRQELAPQLNAAACAKESLGKGLLELMDEFERSDGFTKEILVQRLKMLRLRCRQAEELLHLSNHGAITGGHPLLEGHRKFCLPPSPAA